MKEPTGLEVYFRSEKLLIVAVVLLLSSALLAFGSQVAEPSPNSSGVQVVNPVIQYDTLESLQGAADFLVQTPQALPTGYEVEEYALVAQTIAQVTYSCGEDKLVYRTSTEQEAPGEVSGEFPWNPASPVAPPPCRCWATKKMSSSTPPGSGTACGTPSPAAKD